MKRTIKQIDVKNKKVLVRVDFNVPLDENQNITDDTRIKEALPTIKYLIEQNSKIILISHLGRPKGKDPKLSLKPVAKRLKELLDRDVKFIEDCVGDEVKKAIDSLLPKEVILLENLRFYPEEEKNDEEFAKKLSSLAEVFIQDAFGTVHRAHASTYSVAKFLPSAAGLLLEKELISFSKILNSPQKPFTAILGGAKVSDKINVIKNLSTKVDSLIIGGAMAYTFLKAKNIAVGNSLVEEDKIDFAKGLLDELVEKKVNIFLPLDHIIAKEIKKGAEYKSTRIVDIPEGWFGVDIGETTLARASAVINNSKTILWNGPMGVFEIDEFSNGTKKIAHFIAIATEKGAISIIGGGDTVAAVKKFGYENKFTHVSTGGGASLELLEGKELPGISVLPEE